MRKIFVFGISTIVLIFIAMSVINGLNQVVETNTVVGVVGIISALNILALSRIYAWFLFWDSVIPKIQPEKISELEEKNPET